MSLGNSRKLFVGVVSHCSGTYRKHGNCNLVIIVLCIVNFRFSLPLRDLFFLQVWSPFSIPGGCRSKDVFPGLSRQLYSHNDYLSFIQYGGLPLSHDEYSNRSTEEDPRMLAFFDSLIQREKDSFHSDSDDSVWDDLHLDLILQASSSEGSDSDTIGISVNRLLAREILRQPAQGSPETEPSANNSGQGVLRRLRHLRNAAVIRDLLNEDSSSDEETENQIQVSLNKLPRDLDNGQDSTHSTVTFNRHRRHAGRRYRFHNRLREEKDRNHAAESDSSTTDSGDKKTEGKNSKNIPCLHEDSSSSSDEEKVRENVDTSNSGEAQHVQTIEKRGNTMLEGVNRQTSVDGQGACKTIYKTSEQSQNTDGRPSDDRALGNRYTAFTHKNENIAFLRTDHSSSCGNNQQGDVEGTKNTLSIEESQTMSDDEYKC